MIKKSLRIVVIGLAVFLGIAAVNIGNNDRLFEISKNIELFVNTFKELNTQFVDEVDPSTLMKVGIDAMVNSLDPYTNYYSESQIERYRIADTENFQGVGATVVKVGDKYYLSDLLDGGPAKEHGLHAGDEILTINGETIGNKSEEDVNNKLRGASGSTVKLGVKQIQTNLSSEITLQRNEVNITNVPYSGMVADDIAYIKLTQFSESAAKNISRAFKTLKVDHPNLKGVVLDLRGNGGGYLREAVSICNIFIPQGELVVTTKAQKRDKDQTFKTRDTPEDLDIPLAVLINKRSASASEIVSGVIQDLDRGVIIGQRSFGKGLVQNTFELGYNSRVKITTSKYYIPSGRCIQGVHYENGVPVDIPDSQRSKFKTRNGRDVLDGGGVTPDIKLEAKEKSELTMALEEQHVFFNYANKYVLKHDSIKNIENFKFLDFADFESFTKDFKYKNSFEKELDKLTDVKYKSELDNLKMKIASDKKSEFLKYKDEIILEIEKEIIARYFYEKGRTKIGLDRDNEVKEAIALLKDAKRYNALLKK